MAGECLDVADMRGGAAPTQSSAECLGRAGSVVQVCHVLSEVCGVRWGEDSSTVAGALRYRKQTVTPLNVAELLFDEEVRIR